MKGILVWFMLCGAALAQADYRMIGTNVYDFSYAGGRSSAYSIEGTITHIYPKSVEITTPAGAVFQFMGVPPDEIDRRELSTQPWAMPAFQKGGKPLPAHLYFALSPALRSYFRKVDTFKTNYVLHFTDIVRSQNATAGCRIQTLAVPTAVPGFWDHGTILTNVSGGRFVRVFPKYMVWVNLTNSISSAHNPNKP